MKRFFVFAAVMLAVLTSCDFSFMDKDDDSGGPASTAYMKIVPTTYAEVEVQESWWYPSDTATEGTLKYTEYWWVDSAAPAPSRRVSQIDRVNAAGSLSESRSFTYTEAGDLASASYYGYSNGLPVLKYTFSYVYETITVSGSPTLLLTAQHKFDASDARTDSWLYQWSESGDSAGKLEATAYFLGTGSEFDDASRWYFLPESDSWNMRITSVNGDSKLVSPDSVSVPSVSCARAVTASTPALPADFRTKTDLSTMLSSFDNPSLSMPSYGAIEGMTGERKPAFAFSYEDGFGTGTVDLDSDWYPVSVSRNDKRLEEALRVELERDDEYRITSKKSYYGDTLALQVDVDWGGTGAPAGFPTRVETSGAALVTPMEFDLVWNPVNLPERIEISLNNTKLYYFAFEYDADISLPAADIARPRSIDPFNLVTDLFGTLEDFLDSSVTVRLYETGADNKVGTDDRESQYFVFAPVADPAGLRVSVYKPGVGDAADELNGWYQIVWEDGLAASISAWRPKKDGETADVEVWFKEFGYGADFFAEIASEISIPDAAELSDMLSDLQTELGSLYETKLPEEARDYIEGPASVEAEEYLEAFASDFQTDFFLSLLF